MRRTCWLGGSWLGRILLEKILDYQLEAGQGNFVCIQ
jgi:hypothetical protein